MKDPGGPAQRTWILLVLALAGVAVATWHPARTPPEREPGTAPVPKGRTRGGESMRSGDQGVDQAGGVVPVEPRREPEDPPAAVAGYPASRWRGSLLLRDSTTREEIPATVGTEISATVGTWNSSRRRTIHAYGRGGRVPVPAADSLYIGGLTRSDSREEPPEPAPADERGWVDIVVPGYAAKRVPHPEDGAEVEVLLDRWTSAVRGVLEVPGSEDAGIAMRLQSPAMPEGGSPRLAEPVDRPGSFEIFDMPPGDYELIVLARTPTGTSWARRRIEYRGAPLDLGVISVEGSSGIRARVVDADGRALSDAAIRVAIPGGGSERNCFAGTAADPIYFSAASARPTPGGDGWVELAGLLPGGHYEVRLLETGSTAVEATAPAENGKFAEVTLVRSVRTVRCMLRFTAKGQVPAYWEIVNSPLPAEGWSGPGVFTGELLPGDYEVGLRVNKVDKDPGHATWVKVEVPEEGSFEKSYDL